RELLVKAEIRVERPQGRNIAAGQVAEAERLGREVERAVELERDELAAQSGGSLVGRERLLQLLALDLVQAGEDAVQVAEALQELSGRLRADAGHSGDVVRAVPGERERSEEHTSELQ